MNEEQLHSLTTRAWKQLADLQRTNAKDPYCRHDAENDKYIVEYKCRRKWYDGSTQMEKAKYDVNIGHPNKDYLYVVYDGVDSVHLWNVSRLQREGYDFEWKDVMCPWTTDFNNTEKIMKLTGYLKWDDAAAKVQVKKREN